MPTIGYIFARGGSKGVKRKNLRIIAGKSLLQRAIEVAFSSEYIDTVIVSTDDNEIAEHARQNNAQVPFIRPKDLASDTANEWHSWQHAVQFMNDKNTDNQAGVFVSIPTTTPLKTSSTIDKCIELYKANNFEMVVTGYKSNHHPGFNMVRTNESGGVELIEPPEADISGRQAVPYQAYNLTTACYVTSHKFVLENDSMFQGRVGMLDVGQWIALDIDTDFDLSIAELILRQEHLHQQVNQQAEL